MSSKHEGSGSTKAIDSPPNWNLCIICQNETEESLTCPANSKRRDVGAGYQTLASYIPAFLQMKHLNLSLHPEIENAGENLAEILSLRKASWHKTCSNRFNKTKLDRAKKRSIALEENASPQEKYTRSTRQGVTKPVDVCFFCENGPLDTLHEFSTFEANSRVHNAALVTGDQILLGKLSSGDLIAQEGKYHAKCLTSLYNKARSATKEKHDDSQEAKICRGIAFAELISYLEDSRSENDNTLNRFKMTDLAKLYEERLKQLGIPVNCRTNTTRLKEKILAAIPNLDEYTEGARDVYLAFKHDVGLAFQKMCEINRDNDAMTLARTATLIRRDMLSNRFSFAGSFDTSCEEDSVPKSLFALVKMILVGPNIESQKASDSSERAALSIAQLIKYNSRGKGNQASFSGRPYHSKERETPLPVYLGMKIHLKTRKRELVDTLFHLGLSISYDRLMAISSSLQNSICKLYEKEQVVCPPNLKLGLYTVAALDNIDHNPSSTMARESFHGTGISLFQNPSPENSGIARQLDYEEDSRNNGRLPENFAFVPPAVMKNKSPPIPESVKINCVPGDKSNFEEACNKEFHWLEHVMNSLQVENPERADISWAAYHATQQPDTTITASITSLLPLFREEAHTVAMIHHGMNVIKQAVNLLNPSQIPVIAMDQPLFALAKLIQWTWPDIYGESKFLIMFGGLHIEKASLNLLGDWLAGSGWTDALVQAKVSSAGKADAILKASHITRTRHAHQVTASALHILLQKSYEEYTKLVPHQGNTLSYEEWCKMKSSESIMFKFWLLTLELQLTVLILVRSFREANFNLYVDALVKIAPWFFALDHQNYARWLPVHIRDMACLQNYNPEAASEFGKGNFVIYKSEKVFSSIAIDHAHEQSNKLVKGDGGAVGLTEDPSALLRWMVAGPELARLTFEFESTAVKDKTYSRKHHDQSPSVQQTFVSEVKALIAVIEEAGNPFADQGNELVSMFTKDVADATVCKTVREIEEIGSEQCKYFIETRLQTKEIPLSEPIKRNKLPTFSRSGKRNVPRTKLQVVSLKKDCNLFSRLYVGCQTRDGNLEDFFRHENQSCPPSLSNLGSIRSGAKSDLMDCLQNEVIKQPAESTEQLEAPKVDSIIIDGAALINMLRPGTAKTFQEYADNVFQPHLQAQLRNRKRIDLVWDIYFEDSLKKATRLKRGKGVRRKVSANVLIPGNWQAFLRINDNKEELFGFLAEHAVQMDSEKIIVTTKGDQALCNISSQSLARLSPCTHEEADSRMFLHLADAIHHGCHKAMIRTVDTDVVVLAVSLYHETQPDELWVAFGTGKNFRYVPVHEVALAIGPAKSKALPLFHSLTGCDTVSFFAGIGKKTAWKAWKVYEPLTDVFAALSQVPNSMSDAHICAIERFVILLYDTTSSQESINAARKELFTRKGRQIDAIPPTRDALTQHIKRAIYQGAHVWGQCLVKCPDIPNPDEWGWKRDQNGSWCPSWTTLPDASAVCQELIKCSCKQRCGGRCKCTNAGLSCTAMCKCNGDC